MQPSDSESWATAERLPVWGPSRGGGVLFGVELGPKLKHGITDGKICVFLLVFDSSGLCANKKRGFTFL